MISYSRHASPPYGPKLLVQPTTLSIGRDFLCLVGGGLRGTEIRWLPAMHSKKKEGCWSLQDVALLCLCSEFRVVSKIVVHFVPRPAGRVALFSTNQTVWLPPCRPLMYMLPLLLSFLMIVSPPALWFSTQHSYDRILRCRTTSTVWVSHCVMRLIWHVALNFGCTAAASSRRTPPPGGLPLPIISVCFLVATTHTTCHPLLWTLLECTVTTLSINFLWMVYVYLFFANQGCH